MWCGFPLLCPLSAPPQYTGSTLIWRKTAFMVPIVMVIFWLATLINAMGIRTASWLSIIGAIVGTILPMLFLMILGFLWAAHGDPLAIALGWQQYLPQQGTLSDASFFVVILFSLIGIEMSAVHAGDVKHPEKTFPKPWSSHH